MTKTLSAFALLCAFVAPAAAQTLIHVPDNAPPLTAGNTIPFGSAAYTYMVKIPASFLLATDTRIDEVAMMPAFTGTWTAPNILIGFGHLPTTVPCPFTFPGPGAATIGSFLDFTVAYNSATQGPLSWPCVNNAWCPLGFAALGGTGFVWDGVHDVGFYFTYSGASGGGSIRRAPNGPNTRTYAASYQAATSTACEALFAAYVQLTVSPNGGLNANFTPTSASGAAALTVNFFDASTSDDPNGIQSWAWDFDGDNVVDSTAQNPTFVYVTPGVYTVSLTVTDTLNPPSTRVRVNAVQVGPYVFDAITSGGGVGDLTVIGVPLAGSPTAIHGYTFISFTPATPTGSGPAFGLLPDAGFWQIAVMPAGVGNPLHFIYAPGIYPNVPFSVPAGALSFLAGFTADFVQVNFDANFNLVLWSNVDSVTF